MNSKEAKVDILEFACGCSKPCEKCQTCAKYHGIKKIKYTDIINGVNVLCEMRLMMFDD